MVLIVNEKNSEHLNALLSKKLKRPKSPGNLAKHFGKLKRNIDGLQYQSEMRKHED